MGQTLLRPVRFVGPGPGAHSPEQVTGGGGGFGEWSNLFDV